MNFKGRLNKLFLKVADKTGLTIGAFLYGAYYPAGDLRGEKFTVIVVDSDRHVLSCDDLDEGSLADLIERYPESKIQVTWETKDFRFAHGVTNENIGRKELIERLREKRGSRKDMETVKDKG